MMLDLFFSQEPNYFFTNKERNFVSFHANVASIISGDGESDVIIACAIGDDNEKYVVVTSTINGNGKGTITCCSNTKRVIACYNNPCNIQQIIAYYNICYNNIEGVEYYLLQQHQRSYLL